jgi:4-hydroxy-2-oxoheptanedioate aldolase
MFKKERLLHSQLKILKESYNVQGIKAEFEAEGSAYKDVSRLARICAQLDIKLHLKIGGVEAIRDIKDSLELGVGGLIAPMVESKFAAKKFIDAYLKIYQGTPVHTSLNIETQLGVHNIGEIVEYSAGFIDNITIGRSDLTASYFRDDISPDSGFILQLIEEIAPIIHNANMSVTVGGGVTYNTISKLREKHPKLKDLILKLETRKVIFYTEDILSKKDSIDQALKLEELYILSKKDFSDMYIDAEISRLTELKRRSAI